MANPESSRTVRHMNLTDVDKAYLAGIFDGEGCVGYYNVTADPTKTPYHHASVHICNTDPRVINWVLEVVGFGTVQPMCFKDKKRRVAYQWQIAKKAQVREFLEAIRPFLKVKGDQADVLLALWDIEKHNTPKHGSVTAEVINLRQETERKLKALKRTA